MPRTLNYLILINLLVLLIVPELNSVHYDPERQFWAEITFAWAAVILFILTTVIFKKISIPSIVLPIALFAAYLLIQPYIVAIDYIGINYITAIELLICIFLAIAVNSIKEELGLILLTKYLCYALLIGALLQTIIGFTQYINLASKLHFIFYDKLHPTENIFGHFGQRNHYSHYLMWGFFALIYLYIRNLIKRPIFYLMVVWLSFSLTIASSRSVFLYFIVAIGIAWISRHKFAGGRQLFLLISGCFTVLLAFEYLYPLLNHLFTVTNINSGLERLGADEGAGRRKVEWLKALLVFREHLAFGVGWGGYARQSVLLHHLFPEAAANSGLFTNCHNLILQLLAETGLSGTLIVAVGLILVLIRIFKTTPVSIELIILMCMLGTTLSHSMVEYPLWYLYFLGGMIIFLSIDKPIYQLKPKLILSISFIPVCWLIYIFVANSFIYNTLVAYFNPPANAGKFNERALYIKDLIDHHPLWAYDASYSLDNYINVDTKLSNNLFDEKTQYYYINKFSDFHPYPLSILKQAMLAWNLGDKQRAMDLLQMDLLAFPVYQAMFKKTLTNKKYVPLRQLIP